LDIIQFRRSTELSAKDNNYLSFAFSIQVCIKLCKPNYAVRF